MKYFFALLLIIPVVAGLIYLNSNGQHGNAPLTGLPWQIDRLPNGDTRVFGITLGKTTLHEAIDVLGNDLDLAIIAAPGEAGTLEAYYSHYSAGPITGKLVLMLGVSPDRLLNMQKRAFKDGGTRRYHLHPDDLPLAHRAPVNIITFMPGFNLDEEILQARFGAPDEIIEVHAQHKHFLYADQGLDIILDTDSKEVLQYLTPGEYSAHRTQLQKSSAAGQ